MQGMIRFDAMGTGHFNEFGGQGSGALVIWR